MKSRFAIAIILSCPLLFLACKDSEGQDEPKPATIASEKPVEGIRIAWDYSALRRISPASSGYSGYGRMIKLTDESLLCVFENDGKIQKAKSTDDGASWTAPETIAIGETGIAATVPEILQLADGSLLLSYNMRPTGTPEIARKFGIRVQKSTNNGVDWSEPVVVYQAGHEFGNGCWEPAQIQLPSGQIQLFIANEGPYTSSNEQEITLFRSDDNGSTWTAGEKISFRAGHRDGMPVPLILNNKNEIIFSIEDNGITPTEFKPVIIRTSLENSWNNAPILAASVDREQPLDKSNRIPGPKYAGAPYVRQLVSGEVILSYQGNEFRKDNVWDRSDMIVCIGNDDARNFNRKSTPFYFQNNTKSCMWNSLCVTDENSVWAVGSTNAYGNKSEVWIIKGSVLQDLEVQEGMIAIDGNAEEEIWNAERQVFVGGYGTTNLALRSTWNNDMLFFAVDVVDASVHGGTDLSKVDGFKLYFDPTNKSSVAPDKAIFSLGATASGTISFQQGSGAVWKEENSIGIVVKAKPYAGGYRVEIGIPWTKFAGMVPKNERVGFHVCLYESTTGTGHQYEEPLQGNINNAPYSWSSLKLR